MTEQWIPGQPTTYYKNGEVQITPNGVHYIRRGHWVLMTQEEIDAYNAQQQAKQQEQQ